MPECHLEADPRAPVHLPPVWIYRRDQSCHPFSPFRLTLTYFHMTVELGLHCSILFLRNAGPWLQCPRAAMVAIAPMVGTVVWAATAPVTAACAVTLGRAAAWAHLRSMVATAPSCRMTPMVLPCDLIA
jgi:hypothetical protein